MFGRRHTRTSHRWTLRTVLVLIIVAPGLLATSPVTYAYSCGTPSSGHCYGTTSWQKQAEYFGAYTDLKMVNLSCTSGFGGFVDDEIWLVDRSTPACTSNPFGMCWEETGIIATAGSSPVYFWADSRPLNSNTFNLHLLGGIDPAGTVDHFMIVKDGRVTPNTFLIFDYNDSLSTLYNGVSVVPSGDHMHGKQIIIGQELAGSSGASAPSTTFTRNIWAVQSLGPEYIFWYNTETDKGGVGSANPPSASWATDPASPPPEGGTFTTSCC